MKIEEAITRYKNNAEYERTHGNLQGCLEFRQLVKWLEELRTYRNMYHTANVDNCLREKVIEEEMRLPNMIYREALEKKKQEDGCKAEDITFKDDNAISRLSVRDIIYANAYELEYPDGTSAYVVDRNELIKYLMELPPVYPKSDKPSGKWIPVSEKLPEKDLDYLVTIELTFSRGDTYVSILSLDMWDSSKKLGHEVIAWQPLPKPYKTESEDNK